MDQQQKARRAIQLLEDPVLTEALEFAADEYLDDWMSGEDVEAREAAWHRRHALGGLLRQLGFMASLFEPEPEDEEEPTTDIP